jgi:hypothetical protein
MFSTRGHMRMAGPSALAMWRLGIFGPPSHTTLRTQQVCALLLDHALELDALVWQVQATRWYVKACGTCIVNCCDYPTCAGFGGFLSGSF